MRSRAFGASAIEMDLSHSASLTPTRRFTTCDGRLLDRCSLVGMHGRPRFAKRLNDAAERRAESAICDEIETSVRFVNRIDSSAELIGICSFRGTQSEVPADAFIVRCARTQAWSH